jgi:periplasmic protein CpxP/Spy
MNKFKLLLWVIALLVVANGVLLYTVLRDKPARPLPRNLIIERLNFSEVQVKRYLALIDEHRAMVSKNDSVMLQLKKELYTGLLQPEAAINDSLVQQIGATQMAAEQIHYQHFLAIRKICTPEQVPLFNALTKELASLFSKPRKAGKPEHPPR